MRFVQPAVMALGSAMYYWVATVYFQPDDPSDNTPDPTAILVFVIGWNALVLIATVISIVDAVLQIRAGRTRQLATNGMVVKLLSIPFFLFNFYVLTELFLVGGVTIAFGIGLAFWVVVAIGCGLTYLTMLSTSIYVWAAIARLRRERIIGTGLTVLYALLALLFISDIAAGVLAFGHSRRRPRLTLAVLLLAVGAVFVAFGIWDLISGIADGFGDNADQIVQWVVPTSVGGAVILATAVICLVRRSTLRLEARQAAAARRTPRESDMPEQAVVG